MKNELMKKTNTSEIEMAAENELFVEDLEEVAGGIKIGNKHCGFLSGLWRGGRMAQGKDANEVRTVENTSFLYRAGALLSGYIIN